MLILVGVQEMAGLRSTSLSAYDEGGAGHTAMIYHFLPDIFCTLVIFRSFSFSFFESPTPIKD